MSLARANPKPHKGPIIIAFYSHKGGVGKTTSIHNFSHIFSEVLGYKTLLIDADPQCSLTSLVIARKTAEERQGKSNIYECFDFIIDKELNIPSVKQLPGKVTKISLFNISNNLLFLQGSEQLYKLDKPTALSYLGHGNFALYKPVMGLYNRFFRELGKKHSVDFILLDLNPGATALNTALLMGSDYFVVPLMPDIFSVQAIKSLSQILPDWNQSLSKLRQDAESELSTSLYKMPPPPKLLTVLPQRVALQQRVEGRPVQAFEKWLKDIMYHIKNSLVPNLQKENMLEKDYDPSNMVIIKDFGSQGITAQVLGKPIIADRHTQEVVQEEFARATYVMLSNLSPEDRARMAVEEKYSQLAKKFPSLNDFEKMGISHDEKKWNFPLPFDQEKLRMWLLSHTADEQIRKCAAYDLMRILEDKTVPATVSMTIFACKKYRKALSQLKQTFQNDLIAQYNEAYKDDKTYNSDDFSVDEYGLLRIERHSRKIKKKAKSNKKIVEVAESIIKACESISSKFLQLFSRKENYRKFILFWFDETNFYFTFPSVREEKEKPLCLLDMIVTKLQISLTISLPEENSTLSKLYQFSAPLTLKDKLTKEKDTVVMHFIKIDKFGFVHYCLKEPMPAAEMTKLNQRLEKLGDEEVKSITKQLTDEKNKATDALWVHSTNNGKNENETTLNELKSVALFNHKGGVGKTTFAFNFGYMLAEKAKKKVLLIDVDQQCNLSSLIMQENFELLSGSKRDLKDSYAIMDALIQDPSVKIDPDSVRLYQTRYKNLLLLPSHPSLTMSVELELSKTLVDCEKFLELNLPGKIVHTFMQIAKAHDIDIVLFDLSPANCTVNQILLMGSDYFIVPVFPDLLSKQAIESLHELLPGWYKQLSDRYVGKEKKFEDRKKEIDLYRLPKDPKLLGIIPQRYPVSNRKEGTPKLAFKNSIEEIFSVAEGKLLPILREKNMFPKDGTLARNLGIPDYASMGLLAQISGHTVCDAPLKNLPGFQMGRSQHQEKTFYFRRFLIDIINNIFTRVREDQIKRLQEKMAEVDETEVQRINEQWKCVEKEELEAFQASEGTTPKKRKSDPTNPGQNSQSPPDKKPRTGAPANQTNAAQFFGLPKAKDGGKEEIMEDDIDLGKYMDM